jgi:hypothetical protein
VCVYSYTEIKHYSIGTWSLNKINSSGHSHRPMNEGGCLDSGLIELCDRSCGEAPSSAHKA